MAYQCSTCVKQTVCKYSESLRKLSAEALDTLKKNISYNVDVFELLVSCKYYMGKSTTTIFGGCTAGTQDQSIPIIINSDDNWNNAAAPRSVSVFNTRDMDQSNG